MPGQFRLLMVAISGLLLVSTALPLQAASPTWVCRTAADGANWACFKEGVSVAEPAPIQEATPAVVAQKPEKEAIKPAHIKPVESAKKAVDQALISRLDRGLDWNQCNRLQNRLAAKPQNSSVDDGRTYINADAAELSHNDEVGVFTGNVDVISGDKLLSADEIRHDNKSDVMDVTGSVYFQDPSLRLAGSKAQFNLAADQGYIAPAEYRLPTAMARGKASRVEQVAKGQAHFEDVEYTTCRPGDSSWVLRAKTLDTDQASGRGEATHVRVVLGDTVPIFYSPYISFPIDDRRKTGLLVPLVGASNETGTDVSLPYYLNIAPNYDATITPRVMSRRGLMLAGEFRYLTESHGGTLTGEIIPDDSDAPKGVDKMRGALSIKERGRLAQNLILDMNINHVSDDEYLDDFGGSLAVSSTRQIERRADLTYYGNDWSIFGRLQHFQSTDRTLASTSEAYRRLPQVKFSLERPEQLFGLTYHLDAEYVQFDHRTKVDGRRYDLRGGLSLPMVKPWGFFTPKISARYTGYSLDNNVVGAVDDPNRFIPTLSIDSGLYFDRKTNWFGSAIAQTLEPRAFYLTIPYKNQDDNPLFDTSRNDISLPSLFRENRFNGADRVGDAHQLTLALTSRIIQDVTGRELLRTSVGSILYFRDRKVQLNPGLANEDDSSSEIIAEASARLADAWSGRLMGQWDPHRDSKNMKKATAQLHYRDQKRRIFNMAYRFNRGTSEQTDLSTRWPITRNLSLVGRLHYSLLYNRTMEGFGGFEYDGCCYIVRIVGRHYVNKLENESANNAIFLQLELKGLSRFGSDITTLLDKGIFGYAYDN